MRRSSGRAGECKPEAPPLDGEGLGWGGVSEKGALFATATPIQPSPIKGEGDLLGKVSLR